MNAWKGRIPATRVQFELHVRTQWEAINVPAMWAGWATDRQTVLVTFIILLSIILVRIYPQYILLSFLCEK